jgi:hypothetical protein
LYCQLLKDLILKNEALKFGKITTKAITAKHLVIAYIQLSVVDIFFTGPLMQNRVGVTPESCAGMHEEVQSTAGEIVKKYQKIMEMRILDNIRSINLK